MLNNDIPSVLEVIEAIAVLEGAQRLREVHARRLEHYRSERAVIADLRDRHHVHDRAAPSIGHRWF